MCVQRAAVRKLGHELGIPESQLYPDTFRYLTRLHYCAADTDTYGPDAEWGEHEVGLAFSSTPLLPSFCDLHLMTMQACPIKGCVLLQCQLSAHVTIFQGVKVCMHPPRQATINERHWRLWCKRRWEREAVQAVCVARLHVAL